MAAASTANEQATAEANAAATGAAVPTELADAETRGESIVTAATEGLVTAEEVALATLADVAAITGTDATTGMANAITNGETAVTDAMDQLGSAAVEAALLQMSYATGYKAGYEYAVSIRDGLNAAVAAVRNAAAAISNTVKSNFAGILGTSSGTMIGSNFVAGIAAGINSGKADVVEAAMAVASAATGAAKMILKIRSPSRVARDEIGYMYDMGLVEGLLEGQHEVATAASNVASSLHDEFYVGDPSRETVASSTATASMTGKEVANATNNGGEDPRVLANALAEALVASGALNRVIVMDKKVVGEEIASPVSKSISNKSKSSLNGRSVQGVFA